MSDDEQRKIIQEQTEANERLIRSTDGQQKGVFKGQAPVNERVIKQLPQNERIQPEPPAKDPPKPPQEDSK